MRATIASTTKSSGNGMETFACHEPLKDGIESEVSRLISTERAARMCQHCCGDSKVTRTMDQPDGTVIRKRKCLICGHEWQTEEKLSKKDVIFSDDC